MKIKLTGRTLSDKSVVYSVTVVDDAGSIAEIECADRKLATDLWFNLSEALPAATGGDIERE